MRWRSLPVPNAGITQALTAQVTKDPLLSHLLASRGVKDYSGAKEFFRPTIAHLHDPYRMKDMDVAVERIEKARIAQEHVMVYGDYDVDGTTSVALVSEFLDGKFPIEAYIPDRYKEGYGLSFDGINTAAELGITLIIALDCGIKAFDQINHANTLGIDIIVCDHHRTGDELPKAKAILNPKRLDCLYPYKELSGCGVGFKLCQGLCDRWGLPLENHLYPLLDLCAISIAADIVQISGENRIMASHGMQLLVTGACRPGLLALIESAGKTPETLSFRDLSFTLGPRINAAGRMESGLRAVELLRSKEKEEQQELAAAIHVFNTDRRAAQGEIFEQAKEQLDTELYPYSNVLYDPHWHKGVVGIVASKIVEHHYRPTIILTKSGDQLASVVIEESFDVMLWALEQSDPEGWLAMPEVGYEWVARCDGPFKTALDHTKYAVRYPDLDPEQERRRAAEFLVDLNLQIASSDWLFGAKCTLADIAIAPFVRQFTNSDRSWFDAQPWPNLQRWLSGSLASDHFARIMTKYPKWQAGDRPVLLPSPA